MNEFYDPGAGSFENSLPRRFMVGGGGSRKIDAPTFAAGIIDRHDSGRTISDNYKLSTAYHEAGHIVTNAAVGLAPMVFATVNPMKPGRAGYVTPELDNYDCKRLHQFSAFSLHDIRCPSLPKVIDGKALSPLVSVWLFANTIVLLAGGESTRMHFSGHYDPHRDSNDIKKAEICASRVTSDPAAFLQMAREDSRRIIAAQSYQVEAVANALMQFGSLDGGEITAALSGRPDAVRRRQMEVMAANAALFTATHGEVKRLTI